MSKLIALAIILGSSVIGAEAMPLESAPTPRGIFIKVKDGCGPGYYKVQTRKWGDLCQRSPRCQVSLPPAFCRDGGKIQ
jgi:hypothetical protein